jgi:hypothetical protein
LAWASWQVREHCDRYFNSPLMSAVKNKQPLAVIECLLLHGADPNHRNLKGESVLSCKIDSDILGALLLSGLQFETSREVDIVRRSLMELWTEMCLIKVKRAGKIRKVPLQIIRSIH